MKQMKTRTLHEDVSEKEELGCRKKHENGDDVHLRLT